MKDGLPFFISMFVWYTTAGAHFLQVFPIQTDTMVCTSEATQTLLYYIYSITLIVFFHYMLDESHSCAFLNPLIACDRLIKMLNVPGGRLKFLSLRSHKNSKIKIKILKKSAKKD